MLICEHCGALNEDGPVGTDVSFLACGVCGRGPLIPFAGQPWQAPRPDRQIAGAVTGAFVGAAFGGPVGALIGGIVGLAFGSRQ